MRPVKVVQRMTPVWRRQGGQAAGWNGRTKEAGQMGCGQDLGNLEFPVQISKRLLEATRNSGVLEGNSRAGNFTSGRRPSGDWSRGFPAGFHSRKRKQTTAVVGTSLSSWADPLHCTNGTPLAGSIPSLFLSSAPASNR